MLFRKIIIQLAVLATAALPAFGEEQFYGSRSQQTSGGSAEIQGDANLGRNGVDRTDDIRRTATGELRISTEQKRQLQKAVVAAELVRSKDVAFTVSIGAAVPRQSGALDLPKDISRAAGTEAPLRYLLHNDRLVLIDVKTDRIIGIIPGIQ